MKALFKKKITLPNFGSQRKTTLGFLNSAQFLGVLNDNIFKLLTVFLLIDVQGKERASDILSLAGAIFVIPFLLFSSTAGILADRFSKQRLLVIMKIVEFILMGLAIFAFAAKSAVMSYTILFLLATHSATFGPSKYGIIPELVKGDKVGKANGLITSFTYLAIILGTFLASFLTEITNRNFPLTAAFCLLVALGGLVSALKVNYTKPQGSEKKFNFFFVSEIYKTFVFCKTIPHLKTAMFGSAYFLFMGAFTQLNIIPFAIQSLNLSEVAGGYLFLSTALGIALGAFVIGKILKKKIELAVSCIAGIILSLLLILLSIFSSHLYAVIACLFLVGVFGGVFIVPFDAFIQTESPHEKRGQIIGATNFLSFVGVLFSSIALFIFSDALQIKSSTGFALIGGLTLIFSLIYTARLSDFFFPFLLRRFYTFNINPIENSPILIMRNDALKDALFLLGAIPNIEFIVSKEKLKKPLLCKLFYSIKVLDEKKEAKQLLEIAEKVELENKIPCFFLEGTDLAALLEESTSLKKRLLGKSPTYLFPTLSLSQRIVTVHLSNRR